MRTGVHFLSLLAILCCRPVRSSTDGRSLQQAGTQPLGLSLSGGPNGRGWGGAQAAEECSLGVTAEHPTEVGFRVTMRRWVRGATIRWYFDAPVTLEKKWGPVKPMNHETQHERSTHLTFMLRHAPAPKTSNSRRTDQWGFVLAEGYSGHWRVSCALPTRTVHQPPPANLTASAMAAPPPSPPRAATAPTARASPSASASGASASKMGAWFEALGLEKLVAATTSAASVVGAAVASASGRAAQQSADQPDDNLGGGRGKGRGKRGRGRGGRKTRAKRRRQGRHRANSADA